MAAAEYYTAIPQQTAQHSPYIPPQQMHGSPALTPLNGNSHVQQQQLANHAPGQQDLKPGVHFAEPPRPQQRLSYSNQAPIPIPQQRLSVSSQGSLPMPQQHRPSFSNQSNLQTPSQQYPSLSSSHQGPTPQGPYPQQPQFHPQHMQPYMNNNASKYSLGSGYSSDPEPHRRRHRHREHKEDREVKERPRKNRSRSTNTDGLLGAAGGGLIGDLIFPGLGTVGGVVAGWLGGQGYAKHRKDREHKLDRKQEHWEQRFRSRSGSSGRRDHDRERRSYERHKSDY